MVEEGRTQIPPRTGEGDHAQHGGGGPAILQVRIKQVKRARTLRQKMSLPEVLLWQLLRKRPGGYKFRRQFPFEEVTADFACLGSRLIVEVDGENHGFGDRPRRDASRDTRFEQAGFRVLRIAAREVLKNMDGVVSMIVAACGERGPLHHSATLSGPPPRAGEELA
jgi:very-short-patch-repair endonuclease